MKAKSICKDSVDTVILEIESILSKNSNTNGEIFEPKLAIIFISIKQDREKLCAFLSNKDIDVFGATSSGEFVDGNETSGGVAVLLLDINRDYYQIVFEDIGTKSLKESCHSLSQKAFDCFSKPALILCSTIFTMTGEILDGESIMENIENEIGSDTSMFGGLAGDDFTFTGTFVFSNDQMTDYGMICLVLDENKVGLHGMAISGWKPMGISRTITKSKDNLVFTIDDQPALDIYLKYLGEKFDDKKDQINFFETLGVYYPLQIEREDTDPKMCNPIGYDKEKSALICESNVIEGSQFRFSAPPDFDIVDSVVSKARILKENSNSNLDADAVLIFSCAGRLSSLGPMAQQENEGLFEVWNAPMAGFYTYGEFGRGESGKHEFHSTTNSWVALKEK